ncbi:MAG: acetyl-CoA carboxylase biotin carboxylase subunit [Methanobacteriota archaeon]|nr:MAG: acetyl-CoA carboxylase biotin carboxylase subunit [Euryarchaeota archaeon]
MFKKILVANRGEIAVRVMRAARELGVKNVAVYSDADRGAFFKLYADEAYHIGEGPASKSYLVIDRIIDAALKSGAEAIHPGYGFLAENPAFARACEEAGLVFIGPSPEAIEKMGDKIAAKRIMKEAGVPVVPGSDGEVRSESEAVKVAGEIGYPVLIKASAGGGGIGMKVARNDEELGDFFESSRSIAESAFGNPSILIEKYLEKPRHVEVQLLGDEEGLIHLYERECSIQRRYQKVIEEAPSPVVTPELRERLTAAALRAGEAIDYTNAGTVEFVYSLGDFYFIEMNTRLQVEHPVTEMITGVDIVREQIRIAAGEGLSHRQEDIVPRGWSIECRINAEDPLNDFRPGTGRIRNYRSPGGPGVRVDSGIHMGYTIPHFYDSLVAKLIVWDMTREKAVERMKRALYDYIITGITTNIPLHMAVITSEAFRKGELSTNFIEENNILEEMKKMVEYEEFHLLGLSEIFRARKKTAAIAGAVNSYIEMHKKDREV